MIPVRGSGNNRARKKAFLFFFIPHRFLLCLVLACSFSFLLATGWICSISCSCCVAVSPSSSCGALARLSLRCLLYSVMVSDTVACSHRREVSCSWKDTYLASPELFFFLHIYGSSHYFQVISICCSLFLFVSAVHRGLGHNSVNANSFPFLSSQTSLYSRVTDILWQQPIWVFVIYLFVCLFGSGFLFLLLLVLCLVICCFCLVCWLVFLVNGSL